VEGPVSRVGSRKNLLSRVTAHLRCALRRGRGRPQKADKKVNQTLRLDPDVPEAFRQEGKRLAGAHQSGAAGEHATAPEVRCSTLLPKRRRFRGNAPEGALASPPPPTTPPINRLNVLTRPAPRLSGLGSLFGSDLDYLLRRG
jgi:hypothetical protein